MSDCYITLSTLTNMSESVESGPFMGVPMTTPGLRGFGLLAGDSNPESMELSEDELLNDLVSERSMAALNVHGLWVIGTGPR